VTLPSGGRANESRNINPRASGVAVAAPNKLAADAGLRLGREGGNAVDAALAAILVALTCEPGVASLGGGAFVTIAPADGSPAVTVDGTVEMPGRGLPRDAFGGGMRHVVLPYGGRTEMSVGHGSVATPGALLAFEQAHRLFGQVPWRLVVEPAAQVAREGFPLGKAAAGYLDVCRDKVFAWHPVTRVPLFTDGRPIARGETVHIPQLADFLDAVASEGAAVLHHGPVASAIAADMAANGGLLTEADLAEFEPVVRAALPIETGRWSLATNPPPAIGGPVLAAMLILMEGRPAGRWTAADMAHLIRVQHATLRYRATHLDAAPDRQSAAQALLDGVLAGGQSWLRTSPSTVHVSAAGGDGAACSITSSAGYGSGVTAPGTGVWLNNCLGEHELNRGGLHSLPPGERLASNMAPTVGRRDDGAVLAIGTPGADRITTALLQVLSSLIGGTALQEAIDRPRMHVRLLPNGIKAEDIGSDGPRGPDADDLDGLVPGGFGPVVEHEADLVPPAADIANAAGGVDGLPWHAHPACSMYFGGVAAAMRGPDGALTAAADPRRTGAVSVG
jgi:gamma-glutamyltranspeptidase/glutathione hydrolase